MSAPATCPACGGAPLHGHGTRTVTDPMMVDGEFRFVEVAIRRRRCTVCGATPDVPDPERAGRLGEAVRFMMACYATHGADAAAERLGIDPRTLVPRVEDEIRKSLAGPIPEAVFLGALADDEGALVLGEGRAGIVLDAAEGGSGPLGEILDRRGGDVAFAWVPMMVPIRDAARDVMPDAVLALCSTETMRVLDKIVDTLELHGVAEVALLRHATHSGWTLRGYEVVRGFMRRAGMKRAGATLDLWDQEIRNALASEGKSPGVAVPVELRRLPTLRIRGLAVVTPEPTLATMSRSLVLTRQMRSPR